MTTESELDPMNWHTVDDDGDYRLRQSVLGDKLLITTEPTPGHERTLSILDSHHCAALYKRVSGSWEQMVTDDAATTDGTVLDLLAELRRRDFEEVEVTLDRLDTIVNHDGTEYKLCWDITDER